MVSSRYSHRQYTLLKFRKLSAKALHRLLKEFSLGFQQGLTIKETLCSLRSQQNTGSLTPCIEIVLSRLQAGASLKDSIKAICVKDLQFYTNYLIDNSTHQTTQTMIEAAADELSTSIKYSQQLFQALLYPFFVIQASFSVLILNSVMFSKNTAPLPILPLSMWSAITLLQATALFMANTGAILRTIEKHSTALQLKGLFGLSSCLIKSGIPTHLAIKSARQNLRSSLLLSQALRFELKIRQGIEIQRAFPKAWFDTTGYSMMASSQTGDKVEKALDRGYTFQTSRCASLISYVTKVIPVLCLFFAGCLVGTTILEIYSPLLEAKSIGY
ncbi:type II secretion system F family protein [Marinomonas balearica]|nr:type II secretion system F family protein [Marinomonas balearica]